MFSILIALLCFALLCFALLCFGCCIASGRYRKSISIFEGRAVGGESDDPRVGRAVAAALHAGRLLVLCSAPRVGHEGRCVAGKVAHDDAAQRLNQ